MSKLDTLNHSLLSVCVCVVYRGAFSEVYRGVEKETSREFAIKVIDKKALKGKEEALHNEISVMHK